MTLNSIIDSDNVHAKATRRGLQVVKELTSDLEGWELTSEQDKVQLYKKKDMADPPLVRGDTVLVNVPQGCTPLAVCTVATLPGCRKIWDDKFDQSEVKEYYTRYESLFWVKLKAPWPISPRDFAGTSIRDNEPDTSYCSMISVTDDRIPDTSGSVRGTLLSSGWKIARQEGNNLHITYVNRVDLAGSLPAAFLRSLMQQIPLCAGKVRDYIVNYGFAPTTVIHGDDSFVFKGEEFDHGKKIYSIQLTCTKSGVTINTLCSKKMYSKGVVASLEDGRAEVETTTDEYGNPKIILTDLKEGPLHLTIQSKK